ncbi:radical SAM protein [Actinosynnema sp. NPDC023794]
MGPAAELVLPPLSPVLVGRPYASVPLLAAYAEQRGAPPVRQVNLNQRYVRELFLEAAADGAPPPGRLGGPVADAAERALVEAFPRAVAAAPEDAALLAAVARDPAARRWLFDRAGLAEETGEAADVDVDGYLARLPRLGGMRRFLARHYARLGVPRVVGVSVPFATQLAPALLLAEVVRELAGDGVFVVVGGPLPSLLDDGQVERLLRGSAVDGVVRREGEEAFRRLLALESFDDAALDTVPALTRKAAGRVLVNPPEAARQVALADTAPQAFDPGYLEGAVELPVLVGRGCFYTCAFCDYIELYEKISFRRAEDVTESARLAAAQSTTGRLHLVYEVMSLKYERRLARFLSGADLGVRWRGFQRVYGELTPEDVRLLEESGCVRLDIGLESADDDTLRLMDKGYTRDEIGSFLRSFAGSPVQLLINIIVDYPGLTCERALAAADFLDEVTRDIEDVHFEVLRFALGRNSEMFRAPAKFGLEVAHAPGGVSSPTQVAFRSTWAMGEAERELVEARYRDMNAAFRRRRAEAAERSGLLSADSPSDAVLRDWELRVEPIVVAWSNAVGEGSVVARRLLGGETFVLPEEYEPLLDAYRAVGADAPPLSAFLADAEEARRRAGLTVRECLELLVDLDLVRRRTARTRTAVRTGISSDRGFYRGGVRASSPGVAR